jgi:hypothetical protein
MLQNSILQTWEDAGADVRLSPTTRQLAGEEEDTYPIDYSG